MRFFLAMMVATAIGEVGSFAISSSMTDTGCITWNPAREDHRGQPGAPALGIHLARDHETCPGVDHGAEDAHEVRRAPQRDVDAEESVPKVIDGRGEDGDRDAPRGQVKAAAAGEPQHPHVARSAPGIPGDHAEGKEHGRADARVRHEMRGNPERVTPDEDMPLYVPLDAPARG